MGEVLRHGFRMPDPVLSFRGRSRRELTWQSSLGRYVGCPGDAVGCPMVPTGLPRRGAPRNDNAKTWGMPKRSLDCRVAALLAMTKGGTGMGEVVRHGFRMPGPVLSLRGRSRRELTWQSSLRRYAGCRGDAVGCRMVPLDCRVAALLAMTTGGSGGRYGFVSGFWAYHPMLSLRARQGVAIRSPHFLSLRGRSRRELTWQSSLRRDAGLPGRCGGLPDGSAGLPGRCAPRNDKREDGNGRGGTRPSFRAYHPTLSLRARLGRGNPV